MKQFFTRHRGLFLDIAIAALIVTGITYILFTNEQLRDGYVNLDRKYVVSLTNPEGTSGGTGFYVKAKSGKTWIVTNAHVCGLAVNGNVVVDGEYYAPVIAVYRWHDLCLVGNPTNHSGLRLANDVVDAENIYVIGHPLLEPTSTTKGQIAGEKTITMIYPIKPEDCKGPGYDLVPIDNPLLQFILGTNQVCTRTLETNPVTANILPGNSGSVVVNIYGNVVGVAFAGIEGSGRGYIVPLHFLSDFLKDF